MAHIASTVMAALSLLPHQPLIAGDGVDTQVESPPSKGRLSRPRSTIDAAEGLERAAPAARLSSLRYLVSPCQWWAQLAATKVRHRHARLDVR